MTVQDAVVLSDRMRRTTLSPGDHATVSVDVSTAVSTSGSVVGVMTSTASSPVPVCVSVAVVAEPTVTKRGELVGDPRALQRPLRAWERAVLRALARRVLSMHAKS